MVYIIIDLALLGIYAVSANPAISGLLVHEWVGLGLVLVVFAHYFIHADKIWKLPQTNNARADSNFDIAKGSKPLQPSRSSNKKNLRLHFGKIALNCVILVDFILCALSGLMVSRHILPLLGFVAPGYWFWNPLHVISAKILLALIIVHIVVHLRWFAALPFVFLQKRKGSHGHKKCMD